MEELPAGNSDIDSWLRLSHVPNLPASLAVRCLRRFRTPAALLAADRDALAEAGVNHPDALWRRLRQPTSAQLARDLNWLRAAAHHHALPLADPRYPRLLKQIAEPPLLLYASGDPGVLGQPQLAIVGSRNPSPAGRATAQQFARELSRAGLVITSGLALGIDAAAHRGALAAAGTTIAVAATGLDQVYPARHRDLATEISRAGVVISEFPVGWPPRKMHFPRRNRLISGLSLGTLVVEATPRSGSLITAGFAADQGREVFAVPGPISSPLSRGCHGLIRDGARLTESTDDVLQELGYESTVTGRTTAAPGAAINDHPLLRHMGYDPVSVDSLIHRSGLTADAVCSMLLQLELDGLIATTPGGNYIRSCGTN